MIDCLNGKSIDQLAIIGEVDDKLNRFLTRQIRRFGLDVSSPNCIDLVIIRNNEISKEDYDTIACSIGNSNWINCSVGTSVASFLIRTHDDQLGNDTIIRGVSSTIYIYHLRQSMIYLLSARMFGNAISA